MKKGVEDNRYACYAEYLGMAKDKEYCNYLYGTNDINYFTCLANNDVKPLRADSCYLARFGDYNNLDGLLNTIQNPSIL